MKDSTQGTKSASYDLIGRYDQNQINGIGDQLIERMLEAAELKGAARVLDAMVGDGNLTSALLDFCPRRGLSRPQMTMLEYSRVQAEFARMQLADREVEVLVGDALRMAPLEDDRPALPDAQFDRVLIKSANHEIPFEKQEQLYRSIFRVLKPGGLFVNLGFLFDDFRERDEFKSIARVKDRLAGMMDAVVNRHFLTKDELYALLLGCGFAEVGPAASFEYSIRSEIVAEQYFRRGDLDADDLEHQAAQARARNMRRNGRIVFQRDCSIMRCPGEITVARKPLARGDSNEVFKKYPYEFLEKIEAHSRMLDEVLAALPRDPAVLDVGCGPGLLANRLRPIARSYHGIDLSEEFVELCRGRFKGLPGFSFEAADINAADFGRDRYDAIAMLNVIYIAGIQAIPALRKAREALRPGGRLIIAGPTSSKSFTRAEPSILQQLERDGFLQGNESIVAAIREANAKLLQDAGNYWSVEGMIELLKRIGFSSIAAVDTQIYYGCSYMVVAER